MIKPPAIKLGDTIGITSTARKISKGELTYTINTIEELGYNVKLSSCIGLSDNQFSGNDQERLSAFQDLIDDPNVKAIICARGGYGTVRIIDDIKWEAFKQNPKWVCGYSDVTVLHNHINKVLNTETIHGTMPINFESNSPQSISSLFDALTCKPETLKAKPNKFNKVGIAEGEVIGGNLSILYSQLGSNAQLNTAGKILFIEDLDEYLYHIDRMLMALKRAGILDHLKGLVVGGMTDMNDNAIPFGKNSLEIINEATKEFNYPIGFNFPAGHLDNNISITFGAKYRFEVSNDLNVLSPL